MTGVRTPPRSRWFALALAFTGASLAPRALDAQGPARRGRLHVVWDAEPPAGSLDGRHFFLVDDAGRATRLLPDPAAAESLSAFDRRSVEVLVEDGPAALRLRSVRALDELALRATAPHTAFVTLLCRFPNDTIPRLSAGTVATTLGNTYPGVRQFYAENSQDPLIMSGNAVSGWFMMPRPHSSYVNGSFADFGGLITDCTAAADTVVDFSGFTGINLQFNGALSTRSTPPFDTLSFGGSWPLPLDGALRTFGITWMSSNHVQNYVVYTHEMGHALGWPHSSGSYGQEYDSRWDVMSAGYLRFEPPWGWLTIHTIAHHKRSAGWISDAQRWAPALGASATAVLLRSALPPSAGYLMAEMPATPGSIYTVEARLTAGHDTPLPAQAVVMHQAFGTRAYVVDPDLNSNPNDAGAAWMPGETFHDSIAGVTVTIDSARADGFVLTITRGWRSQVTIVGGGRVTSDVPNQCPPDCATVVSQRGAIITLAAAPDSGFIFAGWSGACGGTGSCVLIMNGNRAVAATFATPLVIVTDSVLRRGTMGAAYADTLRIMGGGPASWAFTGGSLPAGLAVQPDGRITGIASASGAFRFTLLAQSLGGAGSRQFLVEVDKPVLASASVMDQLLGSGTLTADQVRFLDLLGNGNGRLDVGDVRAWLQDAGLAVPPALARMAGRP